jgi:alcohol dehydrogenase class IV
MQFEFATATRIIFGWDALAGIGKLAREFGTRALVVTGANTQRAAKLQEFLEQADIASEVFPIPTEPTIALVEHGAAAAKALGSEFVIAYGGGSAVDAGKTIAAAITNPGDLLEYLEVIGRGAPLANAPVPFIAIPTTAGTGAEVTRNAVLASPEHGVKVSLRSPLMLPKIALVDPALTLDLPPAVTATTGLDALTQLIEPYVCARANPMIDALCVEGIRRVARSLRAAFADGANRPAREDMALASLLGGIALANAGLGAVHGFAAPVGGMFPAPHGAVCAALLPHVMRLNIRALEQRAPGSNTLAKYDEVARLLTGNPVATRRNAIEWITNLVSDLQIPKLGTYGIKQTDLPALIDKASKASSMKANPVTLTEAELGEILQAAI